MKAFLKIFLTTFLCFTLAIGAGLFTFTKFYEGPANVAESKEMENTEPLQLNDDQSDRINFVLLGMEGPRTDTIVFASFDPKNKNLDLVSVPRDTYYERDGHNSSAEKKLNSVYGSEGIDGTLDAISEILDGIPIHHYVMIDYKGVEKVVDSLGGIEVDIPINMRYDDPYDKPPLHINLRKGVQVLDGKNAVKFLRFRKGNNGGGYPEGDLGRIKAQQQFIKSAMYKALGLRLPKVAKTVFEQVKTNMDLPDVLYMAKNAVGIKKDNINMYSLPGESITKELSYFKHDPDATKELIDEIYSRSE